MASKFSIWQAMAGMQKTYDLISINTWNRVHACIWIKSVCSCRSAYGLKFNSALFVKSTAAELLLSSFTYIDQSNESICIAAE